MVVTSHDLLGDQSGTATAAATATSSPIVGVTTAGSRAIASQFFTLYLRVPVKLFRPTRVDYLVLPKLVSPAYNAKPWNFFTHSSPALIYNAVKEHGWSFIPRHIFPPLVANSAVGLVLYTTYLSSLSILKRKKDDSLSYRDTLLAGFLAGGMQSLVAAPIDAIWTRFSAAEVLSNLSNTSMWTYGMKKLREIGYTGVFAGFTLSFLKEAGGYALYFSTFELIKSTWYQNFVKFWYPKETLADTKRPGGRALYPTFVLFAGAAASVALQVVQYPLGKIQKLHIIRLEAVEQINNPHHLYKPYKVMRELAFAYYKTFKQVDRLRIKTAGGSWLVWLYGGFWRNTIMSLPGSSIGLMVFEIMRVRYGEDVSFQ